MSEQALKQQIQNLKKHNARLVRLARDARSKLNAALDGTGLCLWQLDVPTGKLIIYNRRWGSMLGYQPKELSAQFEVWREHLHQDDKQQVLEAFYDHLQGKTPFYEALHRMQNKNGTITWVLDRGRVSEWDAHGNPLSQSELDSLRAGEEVASNTDTIILIRVPNDGSSATAISIPRDAYVNVPGIGMSKINAAFGATKETERLKLVNNGSSDSDADNWGVAVVAEGVRIGSGAKLAAKEMADEDLPDVK